GVRESRVELERIRSLYIANERLIADAKAKIVELEQGWWQVFTAGPAAEDGTPPQPDILAQLAENAPPAILLLFLLSTLSALYRYNLRMAGFYHGRADALELVTAEAQVDPERLEAYARALGADGVDFRGTKTPSDQAGEMASAIIQRFGPKDKN
ncbi:MAG: hypothetical protein AAFR46_14725, partial [Pseudomonadota bacterium]